MIFELSGKLDDRDQRFGYLMEGIFTRRIWFSPAIIPIQTASNSFRPYDSPVHVISGPGLSLASYDFRYPGQVVRMISRLRREPQSPNKLRRRRKHATS
ncbi:hypothetical protein PGTUg99_007679 [Puccinia graminis f. sp. tritici]|uniref:Uncharacterized protein n=1 Tax=Puccinia graminis f. sp. tritici TaxID=56615 RepID=A0A5B0S302_PUCGR|nr:hypothetical protein PGTUg99_007679 [Puccinia graminis f. sp. tritici]